MVLQGRLPSTDDSEHEKWIQEALADLVNGQIKMISQAAMAPSDVSTTDNPPSTSTLTSNNLAVPEIPAIH
jgi:hypothetical protein